MKSSDYFVDFSEEIGLHFGLSPFLIGAIILAFGTSIPELITSVYAVIAGSPEIVIGNVVGSNIANILLVLGSLAIIDNTLKVHVTAIRMELVLLAVTAILLAVFILNKEVSLLEAGILFSGLVAYVGYTVRNSRKVTELVGEENEKPDIKPHHWLLLVLSGAGIFFGAKYTVESIIRLSEYLNIGTEVIALSAVALGTSLPELIVSVMAVRKGNADMALGNILGSNIFNIFSVISIPRFFGELLIPDDVVSFSLPVMLFATFLVYVVIRNKILSRWEGIFLITLYIVFNIELFTGFLRGLIS